MKDLTRLMIYAVDASFKKDRSKSRLAPSLFRGISALRNIVTYGLANVIIFLSADFPQNRLGAGLK